MISEDPMKDPSKDEPMNAIRLGDPLRHKQSVEFRYLTSGSASVRTRELFPPHRIILLVTAFW